MIVGAESTITTATSTSARLQSNEVLKAIAPGLADLGYAVETGKAAAGKIKRPVLLGENAVPSVSYEIDAFHDAEGIVVEVKAGRGARGNAGYRDIVRTSLIVDA